MKHRDFSQALERKDAEGLARLQSVNRQNLLQALRKVKQDAVDEAQRLLTGT